MAVAAAMVLGLWLTACATTKDALVSEPSGWRPLTGTPALAQETPALSELVVEAPSAGSGAWTKRWIQPRASMAWTDETLRLLVKYQQNALRAARALAYVHAAMHDALWLATRAGAPPEAGTVALHRAGSLMLAHLYPEETPGRLEAMGISAAVAVATQRGLTDEHFRTAFRAGTGAARSAIARALTDGSGRVWPVRLRPADKPGQWRAAPPLNIYDPAEAFAGEWRTWLLASGAEVEPPPPISYDGEDYWKDARQVLDVARNLTAEQRKIADYWHLDAGSVTPAGVWTMRARDLAVAEGLGEAQTVRLMAALDVAMVDSLIACWHAKYRWWTLRPVNAIRDRLDPSFLPYLYTPPFPSYVSGHATVSGAAAEVLADFFPRKAAQFRAQAEQAARSRLYGGIHFPSDNEQGLRLGAQVGARAIERMGLLAGQGSDAVTSR